MIFRVVRLQFRRDSLISWEQEQSFGYGWNYGSVVSVGWSQNRSITFGQQFLFQTCYYFKGRFSLRQWFKTMALFWKLRRKGLHWVVDAAKRSRFAKNR